MYRKVLLVFDTGHEEVNVSLYICGECFHKHKELWPGCHVDVTVHLQVQGFGALERVIFISYGSAFAESTGTLIVLWDVNFGIFCF